MKKKSSKSVFVWTICIILIIYCILLLIPTIWGIYTSFKDNFSDFRVNKMGLPLVWKPENYSVVLENLFVEIQVTSGYTTSRQVYLLEMLYNSLFYSVGLALIGTFVTAVMSYMTARYKYKFSKIIYGIVVFTMILPIIGSLPSELSVSMRLGLYDSIPGMFIMKSYFFGLYFLVMFATFQSVPKDFSEAAEIDGASNFVIMFRIEFPFIRNIFITVFILKFIALWNDYQTPLIFIPSHPTVSYGLFKFAQENYIPDLNQVPRKLAACFVTAIPIFILFLLLQKRIMGNLALGGLKG